MSSTMQLNQRQYIGLLYDKSGNVISKRTCPNKKTVMAWARTKAFYKLVITTKTGCLIGKYKNNNYKEITNENT